MGVLRDLTLKKASISEIGMVECVYPWFQTIDISENESARNWTLSSLVNLKFLNLNGFFALEKARSNLNGCFALEKAQSTRSDICK